MAARLSDRVTYAYCDICGHILIIQRQAELAAEVLIINARPRRHIRHAWCAVAETFTARVGQMDRRN